MEFGRSYFPLPLLLHPTGIVRTLKTLKCRRMVYIWHQSGSDDASRLFIRRMTNNLCASLWTYFLVSSGSILTRVQLKNDCPRHSRVSPTFTFLIDMAWISATAPRFHRDIQCHVHFQLKGERTRDLIRTSNTRNLVGTWHISYAGKYHVVKCGKLLRSRFVH